MLDGRVGVKTPTASLAITFVAADADLLALFHALPEGIHANIHRRFFAASADVFDFFDIVGQSEEVRGARERFSAKIRTKTVADHGNAAHLSETVKLSDLRWCKKLRFIDQEAGDLRALF